VGLEVVVRTYGRAGLRGAAARRPLARRWGLERALDLASRRCGIRVGGAGALVRGRTTTGKIKREIEGKPAE
jgi:hypothetical protein